MKTATLADYDGAGEFIAKVDCLGGPGFFPVHSGRLSEGLSRPSPVRVVIFGTDWGSMKRYRECDRKMKAGLACGCQCSLRRDRPQPYPTERNLFNVLAKPDLGLDLATVFMTNAVLGLVTAPGMTKNEPVFRKHPDYLLECGEWHRQWLRDEKPRLVVLMGSPGRPHGKAGQNAYWRFIWPKLWPKLFGHGGVWSGATSLKEAFLRQTVASDPDSGLRVQLMYHPSSRRHWWKNLPRTEVDLKREIRVAGAAAPAP